MNGSNVAVMYGMPPDYPDRQPDIGALCPPTPALVPCPACKRHIHFGSMCPFCFAEQIAKAPGRAALEAVKKSLEEALQVVNQALNSKP